jgi:hypothetical protein
MDETDKDPSPTDLSQEWAMPPCPNIPHNITAEIQWVYKSHSVCILPRIFFIPAETMRHLTDELLWVPDIKVDKTYETIRMLKKWQD